MILTDEEIANITHSVPFGSTYSAGNREVAFSWNSVRVLNKAQLKKVAEYLDTFNDKPVGEEVRLFINRFRQSLLEEVN